MIATKIARCVAVGVLAAALALGGEPATSQPTGKPAKTTARKAAADVRRAKAAFEDTLAWHGKRCVVTASTAREEEFRQQYPLTGTDDAMARRLYALRASLEAYLAFHDAVHEHADAVRDDPRLSQDVVEAKRKAESAFIPGTPTRSVGGGGAHTAFPGQHTGMSGAAATIPGEPGFDDWARVLASGKIKAVGEPVVLRGKVVQVVTIDERRYGRLEVAEHAWFVIIPAGQNWSEGTPLFVVGRIIEEGSYPTVLGTDQTAAMVEGHPASW